MTTWFRMYAEVVDDPKVQMLPPDLFKKMLIACLNGSKNEFSRFVRPGSCRPPSHEWRIIRERVFARDNYTCAYCGEHGGKLQCDHVFPVARGGGNEDENLVAACERCNRSKRDRLLEDWLS
jgi:hypothetical protein